MIGKILTAGRPGFHSQLVTVEADILNGLPNLTIVGGSSVGDDFTLIGKDCSPSLADRAADGAVDEEGCGRVVLLELQDDSTWSESDVPDDVFPAVAQVGFVGRVGDSRIAVASASAKWVSVFDTVKRSWQRFDGPDIEDRSVAGSCSTRGHLFVVFAPMAGPVSPSAGEADVMVFREMTAQGDWSPQVEVERAPSAQQPAPGVACGGGAWTLPVGTNRWATITSSAHGEALTARSKDADFKVPNPVGGREGAVLLAPDALFDAAGTQLIASSGQAAPTDPAVRSVDGNRGAFVLSGDGSTLPSVTLWSHQ